MDRLVAFHASNAALGVPPEVEAAWLHHRFVQIHPFQDGNGRVARALASLVMIQRGLFPLVVTRDDKHQYLTALEAADTDDLGPLVRLVSRLQKTQFRRAIGISESLLDRHVSVVQAVGAFQVAASKKAEEQRARWAQAFQHAEFLESHLWSRLEEMRKPLEAGLVHLKADSRVVVDRSSAETDYYFRGQIIDIAKHYLGYFADTQPYRSWIRLRLQWSRFAQIVFAFHSTGSAFAGVLVCAPFLEFRDDEGDGDPRSTLVNVAEEPFEIFHDHQSEEMKARFDAWMDSVLTAALAELQRNL